MKLKALALAITLTVASYGVLNVAYSDDAFEHLIVQAGEGDVEAAYKVGKAFLTGQGAIEDTRRGLMYLEQAARGHHAFANTTLAQYYDQRQGEANNRGRMLKYYREAAILGDTNAQARLGRLLLDAAEGGQLQPAQAEQARTQAFALLEHAAKNDNRGAQWYLGESMMTGRGMLMDKTGGRHWLTQAANQGHSTAAYVLAIDALRGGEGSPDYNAEAGLQWLTKAAELGHSPAMLELAAAYEKGEILNADLAQAAYWADKANKVGTPGAQELFARINAARESQVGELETQAAQVAVAREDLAGDIALLEAPSSSPSLDNNLLIPSSAPAQVAYVPSNNPTPESSLSLSDQPSQGLMALVGKLRGEVQHLTEENNSLREQLVAANEQRDVAVAQLAKLDEKFRALTAQTNRLKQYQTVNAPAKAVASVPARVAPINASPAVQAATNRLNAEGMKAYAKGDYAKARRLFEQASIQGDAEGTNNLATLYMRAAGADLNIDKAIALYEQASAMGYAPAAKNLAFIYKNGEGVQPDSGKAAYWESKAREMAMYRVTSTTRG